MRHLLTLIKVRITGLVTLTAMAGYGLAPSPEWGWPFVGVTVGVFLITAGASAVNMYLERRTDALMNRTRTRPLTRTRTRTWTRTRTRRALRAARWELPKDLLCGWRGCNNLNCLG